MNHISIQEHLLIGYSVLCEKREVHLVTEHRDQGESISQINVKFEGVWAYLFNGDNLNTILYGIEEYPIDELLRDYQVEFEQGSQFSWPGSWNTSLEEAGRFLKSEKFRAWKLVSSHGMGGFVIGKDLQYYESENCSGCHCR